MDGGVGSGWWGLGGVRGDEMQRHRPTPAHGQAGSKTSGFSAVVILSCVGVQFDNPILGIKGQMNPC